VGERAREIGHHRDDGGDGRRNDAGRGVSAFEEGRSISLGSAGEGAARCSCHASDTFKNGGPGNVDISRAEGSG